MSAPTKSEPLTFAIVGHAVFEFWTSSNGRWYWHRRVNDDVTESGNYASRRSCRRKLHQVVANEHLKSQGRRGRARRWSRRRSRR